LYRPRPVVRMGLAVAFEVYNPACWEVSVPWGMETAAIGVASSK
jgi:hypothetical protein